MAKPDNVQSIIDPPRGRPRKGTKAAGASARSLRLPDVAWLHLEELARARKMSLHRLLKTIVGRHLAKHLDKAPRRSHRAA